MDEPNEITLDLIYEKITYKDGTINRTNKSMNVEDYALFFINCGDINSLKLIYPNKTISTYVCMYAIIKRNKAVVDFIMDNYLLNFIEMYMFVETSMFLKYHDITDILWRKIDENFEYKDFLYFTHSSNDLYETDTV